MKDTNVIFEEMVEELEGRTGIRVNRGGDMALRLYAVAAELASLWVQSEWLKKQSFPQTAIGECLDMHAQTRGLERGKPVCATGLIRFEIDEVRNSELVIEAGTVCLNPAGVEFLTTENGIIAKGDKHCLAAAEARIGGSFGNVPAGSIRYMSLAPVGVVRCCNPAAFSGGAEEETDESLRARVMASYASLPNGSNIAFYEQEALNTDGVAAVRVLPCKRGNGTVDIIIAGPYGLPSQNLISSLRARLEKQREICVDISVLPPTTVSVAVSVDIDVLPGFDAEKVVCAVSDSIRSLFDGKMLGKDILLAKLGSVIYGVEGVENYAVKTPAADILISYNELPVLGSVDVKRR